MQFDNGRHSSLSFRQWDLMAELVLQISSLSFQYERSRKKLNILKLYVTYLGFCGVYSFLLFLSLLGPHNTLIEGYTSYFW